MTNELFKCPFCGSDAELSTHWHGHVGCSNERCGARYANLSVEQWNTRPALEPPDVAEPTCAICGEHANEHLAIPHQFMPGGRATAEKSGCVEPSVPIHGHGCQCMICAGMHS